MPQQHCCLPLAVLRYTPEYVGPGESAQSPHADSYHYNSSPTLFYVPVYGDLLASAAFDDKPAYHSASLVMAEAEGAHSKSGSPFSCRTHSLPLMSCMSPFVGLLMKSPVLTSSERRSCGKGKDVKVKFSNQKSNQKKKKKKSVPRWWHRKDRP